MADSTFFKTPLCEFSNANVTVYMVDGSTIRDPKTQPYYQDFTEGGNDMAYDGKRTDFKIPPGEVWIDLDVAPTEVRCTILHELTERRVMINDSLDYDNAHETANKAEKYARLHRDQLNDLCLTELSLAPAYREQIPILEESMNTAELKALVKEAIRKTLSVTVEPITDGSRVIIFDASNETKDRDGEVIKASAWDLTNYLKNPVVQWAHKYDEPPVGKSPGINVSNGVLKLPVEFPPEGAYEFADIIYRLAKGGFISAVSVGFIPKEFTRGQKEGDPSRTYTKVELLEVSIVPVPSNPDAIVSARDAGVITAKQFDMLSPPLDIQSFVRSHPKSVSQEEIKDELDYCLSLISGELNEENKSIIKNMGIEIKRITGGDIPVSNKAYGDIIFALDEHHKAHNKVYKDCKDALSSIVQACNDSKSEVEPEKKPGVIDMDILTSTIEHTMKEYWRKSNGT